MTSHQTSAKIRTRAETAPSKPPVHATGAPSLSNENETTNQRAVGWVLQLLRTRSSFLRRTLVIVTGILLVLLWDHWRWTQLSDSLSYSYSSSRGGNGRYFQSTVHVVQMSDLAYATKMRTHMDSIRHWANCGGYNYSFMNLNDEIHTMETNNNKCMSTIKVGVIRKALHSIPINDWLIFLDMDVQYIDPSCHTLERILPLRSRYESRPCELIALGSHHTINTGILILKSTNVTRQIVTNWHVKQQELQMCGGVGDQISFQVQIMDKASRGRYDGHCEMLTDQHDVNLCYRDVMIRYGYPEGKQSFEEICLLSCWDALQCHDCTKRSYCRWNKEKRGKLTTVFWHDKVPIDGLELPTAQGKG